MSANITKLYIRGQNLYRDYVQLQKGWEGPWGDLLKTIEGGEEKLAAVRNMAEQMRVAVELLERIGSERQIIEQDLQRASKPVKPPTGNQKAELLRQVGHVANELKRVRLELAKQETICNKACTEHGTKTNRHSCR